MTLPIRKIISGGQTGADIGGLLGARQKGIETGGFAPHDWLTEAGPQEELLRSFGLTECQTEGYAARTRRNIETSDGTLLVGSYETGGSLLTYEIATEMKKPLFHLGCSSPPGMHHDPQRLEEFRDWLDRYQIRTLNVAGNRESASPGIAEFTRTFLLNAMPDA